MVLSRGCEVSVQLFDPHLDELQVSMPLVVVCDEYLVALEVYAWVMADLLGF